MPTPERAAEVADVRYRTAAGRGWTRYAPGHHLKLQSASPIPQQYRGFVARIDIIERGQIVAVAIKRSE